MNNRIAFIDIAKGISIILVAMIHIDIKRYFPEILASMSLFRMPLFFFLSGIFFSISAHPKSFLLKKSEALLKPYFSVQIFLLCVSALLYKNDLFLQFVGIFYGTGHTIRWVAMWFLTHLFSIYCFSYILFRYTNFGDSKLFVKIAILFVFFIVGVLSLDVFLYLDISIFGLSTQLPGLPFSLDMLLITSVFFISGYLFKEKIINFIPNIFLLSLSISVFLCITFFTEAHIDLHKRIYQSPVFATLGAVCGIYMVLCISYCLVNYKIIKNIFVAVGNSSLYILIFHRFIGYKTYTLGDNYLTRDEHLVLLSLFALLLSITLPLAIKWIVNRNSVLALFFLPFKSNKLLQRK